MLAAMIRLAMQGASVIHAELGPLAWTTLIANLAFMLYTEGYRGFQKRYAPRFGRRVAEIRERGTPLQCVLSPLYCMGFFHAPRRELVVTWLLTAMIVGFIIIFRLIPQPWRGILDFGVVAGLAYGTVACWYFVIRCWRGTS